MPITDPTDIPGLRLWVSADEISGLTDGQQITTWNDNSGNANHLTGVAGSGGAKPLYRTTAGSGGGPAVEFQSGRANAVGGYFTIPAAVYTGLTSGSAFVIVKSGQDRTTLWQMGPQPTAVDQHFPYDDVIYEDAFVTSRATYVGTFTGGLNQWRRYLATMGSGTQSAYRDNTLLNTASRTFGLPSSTGKLGGGPSLNFAGHVTAFCVFDHVLTSGERSDLESWAGSNPSGGEPSTTPEVAADWTGEGTWTADVVPVAVVAADWTGAGEFTATVDSAIAPVFSSADEHVPLTVRVGDKHITREVSGLAFRKEAVGGLKSITLRLARPLNKFDPDIQALSTITVYDGRSAEIVAQGRVSDLGRSASASDGQQNEIVGFGPGQHVADKTFPYALVDTGLEAFTRSTYCVKKATATGDERAADEPSLVLSAEEGKAVSTAFIADMIHRGFKEAGMKLGRVRCRIDAGVVSADWELQLVTRDGAGSPTVADSATADTAAAILAGQVVTDFPNGDNVVSVRAVRNTSGVTATEDHWFEFWEVAIRARLKDETGADITTGYGQNYVLAHEAVKDLLGRVLDQYDGANSVIDTSGTYQIDQFAYFDGVTAEQVLNDLMVLEPAYRWWAEPNATGTAYVFHWEAWPTTVRYEVTLDDGGDFPASAQELYNEVTVRWRGPNGRTRSVTRTLACAILDDAGITRSTVIDLGDEVGSAAAATRAGDNFLAEHNVPANAGTITISRPIRDLSTGRTVRPHQIREGELIRVRGIESYPDALNASSNDGQTVFRIWSVTYSSDTDSAACELDIPSRSTTNALVKLAKRRLRKR